MADVFIEWYYCDDDIKPSDVTWFWVVDNVGGVLYINDHFWSMHDLIEIFDLCPTEEQLWKWKNESGSAAINYEHKINLRSWLKFNNQNNE
jgi:hypothetical protein